MGEKRLHLRPAPLPRMLSTVEANESAHPVQIFIFVRKL
jgi:hypothetical protein